MGNRASGANSFMGASQIPPQAPGMPFGGVNPASYSGMNGGGQMPMAPFNTPPPNPRPPGMPPAPGGFFGAPHPMQQHPFHPMQHPAQQPLFHPPHPAGVGSGAHHTQPLGQPAPPFHTPPGGFRGMLR